MSVDVTTCDEPAGSMTLYVCTTCRDADHVPGQSQPCAGARLHAALEATPVDPAIKVVPVECLSVCKRTCAVSFTAPGKWTYVYGDIPPDVGAPSLIEAARLYARTSDGIIPWRQRPEALKRGAIARIPPLALP